jgi:hypothetical protein
VKACKHVLHNKNNERHFGDNFFVRQCTLIIRYILKICNSKIVLILNSYPGILLLITLINNCTYFRVFNITSMVKGFLLATEGYDWRAEDEPVTFWSQ